MLKSPPRGSPEPPRRALPDPLARSTNLLHHLMRVGPRAASSRTNPPRASGTVFGFCMFIRQHVGVFLDNSLRYAPRAEQASFARYGATTPHRDYTASVFVADENSTRSRLHIAAESVGAHRSVSNATISLFARPFARILGDQGFVARAAGQQPRLRSIRPAFLMFSACSTAQMSSTDTPFPKRHVFSRANRSIS